MPGRDARPRQRGFDGATSTCTQTANCGSGILPEASPDETKRGQDARATVDERADTHRAARYRVFLKRIGTDTDFFNVDDAEDLDYLLKNLTPGATIEVYIVASTAGLYAPPSPKVSKVVAA